MSDVVRLGGDRPAGEPREHPRPARARRALGLEHQERRTLPEPEAGPRLIERATRPRVERAERAEAGEGEPAQAIDAARERALRAPALEPRRCLDDRDRAARARAADGHRALYALDGRGQVLGGRRDGVRDERRSQGLGRRALHGRGQRGLGLEHPARGGAEGERQRTAGEPRALERVLRGEDRHPVAPRPARGLASRRHLVDAEPAHLGGELAALIGDVEQRDGTESALAGHQPREAAPRADAESRDRTDARHGDACGDLRRHFGGRCARRAR